MLMEQHKAQGALRLDLDELGLINSSFKMMDYQLKVLILELKGLSR